MRSMLHGLVIATLTACSGGGGPAAVDAPTAIDGAVDGSPERDARFLGLWAVEQPNHALYEVTYYRFAADGTVTAGPSDPAGCSGHLSQHCVTGSVARCAKPAGKPCRGTPTCTFGDLWRSADDRTLVLYGVCSDGVARDIALSLDADTGRDTRGVDAAVVTVGGEPGWGHDNWDWSFRKCPAGTTPATCHL